jgi:hypothetical protein
MTSPAMYDYVPAFNIRAYFDIGGACYPCPSLERPSGINLSHVSIHTPSLQFSQQSVISREKIQFIDISHRISVYLLYLSVVG